MKNILDWSTLTLFISVASIMVFMPGPNTLYIIARSIQQGRLAGFVSSLGVQVGTMVHMIAAALGISALLVSSAVAFQVVKYAGAAYLIYLGIRTLLSKDKVEKTNVHRAKLSRVFYQGVVVNVLNPKTALFFFAFLSQFINPTRGAVGIQVALLGSILIFLGTLSDSIYALASGSIGNWLRGNLKFVRAQRYFAGTVYISLGAATAFSGVHKNR
jgi:threonine/homoserine/homoserine lactone efflux protein